MLIVRSSPSPDDTPLARTDEVEEETHLLDFTELRCDFGGCVVDQFSGFSVGVFQLYPQSRGTVHIQSANPEDDPAIKANYMTHPKDKEIVLRGMREIRRVMSQPAMLPYVVREVRPGQGRIRAPVGRSDSVPRRFPMGSPILALSPCPKNLRSA